MTGYCQDCIIKVPLRGIYTAEVNYMVCEHECANCQRTKPRTEQEVRRLINRLNRIEGQIRGIRGMVEKDAYCPDILGLHGLHGFRCGAQCL